MAKKRAAKKSTRRGPHVHNVVREIKKVIAATKGRKELAAKHKKMKQLLARTMETCEGNGFYLA
jgi:hypothetical protein